MNRGVTIFDFHFRSHLHFRVHYSILISIVHDVNSRMGSFSSEVGKDLVHKFLPSPQVSTLFLSGCIP